MPDVFHAMTKLVLNLTTYLSVCQGLEVSCSAHSLNAFYRVHNLRPSFFHENMPVSTAFQHSLPCLNIHWFLPLLCAELKVFELRQVFERPTRSTPLPKKIVCSKLPIMCYT